MGFDYKQRISTKIADKPIGKLLDSLKMESAFFTSSRLSSPWALSMPPMHNCMMFHLVLSGKASFSSGDSEFTLCTGDFALFPRCDGHVLSDGKCNHITPLEELPIKSITERYETLDFGGDGGGDGSGAGGGAAGGDSEVTKMVCGALVFQHPLAIKLLGILPHFIKIDSQSEASAGIVKNISDLLQSESQRISIGAEAVIARLAELLVMAAMRQHLIQLGDDQLGWIAAMEDDRIGKALKLIHDQPQKHWSLEELASNIGMSRTSFASQFKRLVGNTPMDYLTEWRMSLAYSKLQLSKDTVLSIALDIGYQSEASFSRAFKKVIGKSPGEVRKSHQTQGSI